MALTDLDAVIGPGVPLAERLLTIPYRLRGFTRTAGVLAAAVHSLARELEAEGRIDWAGNAAPDVFVIDRDVTRIEIRKRDAHIAQLVLEREEPFTREELRLLSHVGISLSEHVTELSERMESRLLMELSTALPSSDDLDSAARRSMRLLVDLLGAEAGVLLLDEYSGLRVLAAEGYGPASPEVTDEQLELARTSLRAQHTLIHQGGLVAAAVGTAKPARYALLLRFPADVPFEAVPRTAVEQAARTLAPHLNALRYANALEELLDLHEASAEVETRDLYGRVLDTAIRLVPGSDSGSLLTRNTRNEPFVFQATRGFEQSALEDKELSARDLLTWYGPDLAGWQRGRPRILRGDEHDIARLGAEASPSIDSETGGYERIKATLCLPVLHEGEVMAILNLENCSRPDAFGRDSLDFIQLFGPTIASLVHRQHIRDLLMNEALTDELTGLKNRRAFDDALARELARRQRAGNQMSLLLMDLRGFKDINDSFGHDVGDAALSEVARVLSETLRQMDMLSRWGGDEFAAILIDTPEAEAKETADRIREVIGNLVINGKRLGIDIGTATAPDEGATPEELLALADKRMYEDKRN